MSDTPETDAFFFRTDIEWDDEVEFARQLERERDEAREHLREIKEYGTEEINAAVELRQKLAQALIERDEAREDSAHWKVEYEIVGARLCGWKHPRDNGIIFEHEIIPKLTQERDKAREDATNYYARIGELESERDNAPGRAERASI